MAIRTFAVQHVRQPRSRFSRVRVQVPHPLAKAIFLSAVAVWLAGLVTLVTIALRRARSVDGGDVEMVPGAYLIDPIAGTVDATEFRELVRILGPRRPIAAWAASPRRHRHVTPRDETARKPDMSDPDASAGPSAYDHVME